MVTRYGCTRPDAQTTAAPPSVSAGQLQALRGGCQSRTTITAGAPSVPTLPPVEMLPADGRMMAQS
jgi:hypothetical protein